MSCRPQVPTLHHDDPAAWRSVVDLAVDAFGGPTGLVNNAGIAPVENIEDESLERWRRTLSVNLDSVYCGCQQAIRVNSVHSGHVDTALMNRASADRQAGDHEVTGEAILDQIIARHPMGHLGCPEEIAAGIALLLSEDANSMTGSELVVDGGYTAT